MAKVKYYAKSHTGTDPVCSPRVMPDWGLITSEETIGDEITIRMYPDEVNEPVNVED